MAEAIYKRQGREMSRPPRVADRLYAQGGVRINLSTPHLAPRTSRVKKCGPPGPEPSYLPHGKIPWDVLAGPGLTGVVDAGTRPS